MSTTKVTNNATTNVNTDINPMEALQRLRERAALVYGVGVTTSNVTMKQRIEEATKRANARINLSTAIELVKGDIEAQTAAGTLPAGNIDVDKTAKRLVSDSKAELTKLSKIHLESSAANPDMEISLVDLDAFTMSGIKINYQMVDIAPLFKGSLVQINFSTLSTERIQTLYTIGITEAAPFGMITSITFDKTSNAVYCKVSGENEKAGTVRMTIKNVTLLTEFNTPEQNEAYTAKVNLETAKIEAAKLKISHKQFDYVAGALRKHNASEDINNAWLENIKCAFVPAYDANGVIIGVNQPDNATLLEAIALYLQSISATVQDKADKAKNKA